MKLVKYTLFLVLSVWSISVWQSYFEKKEAAQQPVTAVDNLTPEAKMVFVSEAEPLSEEFWQWEAKGKLNLIDKIIDSPVLMHARSQSIRNKDDTRTVAENLIRAQMTAYNVDRILDMPKVIYTPLRGDANGLYVPQDKTIYLNNRMKWDRLNFERFAEVILHENMHHIMTHMYGLMDDTHFLYPDFKKLALASMAPGHLANSNDGTMPTNLQEMVAYKTQRVARYAGMQGSDLSAWEMSTRMQEIRAIKMDAGL